MKHRIVQALAGLLVLSFACRAAEEDYEHYTRYVESDGTQSIDLGFTLSSDMTIECVYEQLDQKNITYQALFGARTDASTGDISFFSGEKVFMGSCQTGGSDSYKTYRNRFLLLQNFTQRRYLVKRTPTEGWTLTDLETGLNVSKDPDGQAQGQTWGGETFSTANNIKLFTIDGVSIDGSTWGRASMRLYLLRVSDSSGKVLHEIIPGQEGDRVGVYDTVTGDYLYPTGGNALKMADRFAYISCSLSPNPPLVLGEGMRRVDYVESDGSQSIDLGMPFKAGWSIEMDFELTEIPSKTSAAVGLLGSRLGTGALGQNISALAGMDNVHKTCFYGDYNNDTSDIGTYRVQTEMFPNKRYTLVLSPAQRALKDDLGVLGDNKNSVSPGWETSSNAKVFAVNGFAPTAGTNAMARVYRLKITDAANSLIHDYIPCLSQGGEVGLYDTVTGDFAKKETGNPLAYGAVIDPVEDVAIRAETVMTVDDLGVGDLPVTAKAKVRSVLVPKRDAFVESAGSQFIDLGFPLSSDMKITINFSPTELAAVQTAASGILGARSGAGSKNISLFLGPNGTNRDGTPRYVVAADLNNGSYNEYRNFPTEPYEVGARYTVEFPARKVYKNGTLIAEGTKLWSGSFTTASNAHLFDITDTGWAKAKIRFYSLIIETNGVEMCHFVPAVRDGHIGIEDMAGDKGFKYPENSGAKPLVYSASGFSGQHEFTEEVVLTAPGEVPFKAAPLKLGTIYDYVYSAENDAVEPVTFKGQFETPPEAWPASYTPLVYDFPEKNPKPGKLTVILSRSGAGAADQITAVYGSIYGGADPAKWQHSAVIGRFASGEVSATVTLALPKDTVYLRFYTTAGGWTETVFIPETKFVPGSGRGLVIFVH